MSTIPIHPIGVAYSGLHATTGPDSAGITADLTSVTSKSFTAIRTYYPQYGGSIGLIPLIEKAKLNALLSLYIFPDHLTDWVPSNYTDYVKPYLSSSNLLGVLIGNEDYGNSSDINATIEKYLKQVKAAASDVPVGTAQTTDFWLNNPDAAHLAKLCDFIAVNIYPAWDWGSPDSNNQPQSTAGKTVPVDTGFSSFEDQFSKVQKQYSGMQIVVTETGWPTTYGWVVKVPSQPKQYQVGLDNASSYFKKVSDWATTNGTNVYYYSMFDDWHGVNTTSQFNFHFGLLDTGRSAKTAT